MAKWEVVNPHGYESVSITEDGRHVGTWMPESKAKEIARKLNAFEPTLQAFKDFVHWFENERADWSHEMAVTLAKKSITKAEGE